MFFLVYKTVNLVNGNYYYGSHRSNSLKDRYLGSGKRLACALRKYGRENFQRRNVAICTSEEAMLFVEKRLVSHHLGNPCCYNLIEGGSNQKSGGSKLRGRTISEAQKLAISRAHRGKKISIEHREAILKSIIGRKKTTEEIEKIRAKMIGRKLSLAQCEKMRQARLGKGPPCKNFSQKVKDGMARAQLKKDFDLVFSAQGPEIQQMIREAIL